MAHSANLISTDDLARQLRVAAHDRRNGLIDHALSMAAHGGDLAGQIFQLVVIRTDDVVRRHDSH